MGQKRAASSTRSSTKAVKVNGLADSDAEPAGPSGPPPAIIITQVVKPTPAEDLQRLQGFFSEPVIEKVFLGQIVDKFPIIITNKRVDKRNGWIIMARDKFNATSAFGITKKIGKVLHGISVPAAANIDFILTDKGEIQIEGLTVLNLERDVKAFIKDNFVMPEIVTAKTIGSMTTAEITIWDLEEGNDQVELVVDITKMIVKSTGRGKRFMMFDARDETETISGRVWEKVDSFASILKSGATVRIKHPKVVVATAEFNGAYTSPFQLVVVPDRTTTKAVHR